jgi:hypothetical protein
MAANDPIIKIFAIITENCGDFRLRISPGIAVYFGPTALIPMTGAKSASGRRDFLKAGQKPAKQRCFFEFNICPDFFKYFC